MYEHQVHGVTVTQLYARHVDDDYRELVVVDVLTYERSGDVVVWDLGQQIERRIAVKQLMKLYTLSEKKAWCMPVTDTKTEAQWWVLIVETLTKGEAVISFYHEVTAKVFKQNTRAKVRQFVSNYYLSKFQQHPESGLNLHGREPLWLLSAETVKKVKNWAKTLPISEKEMANV